MKKLVDEYWKKVCERDADWKSFCKVASEENWIAFQESDKEEKRLKSQLDDLGISVEN